MSGPASRRDAPRADDPGDPGVSWRQVTRVSADRSEGREDAVAVEGALEIRIDGPSLAVTLRTPGHDRELALGFLFAEQAIDRAADVAAVREIPAACADEPDIVDLTLAPGVSFDWTRFERRFAATSACGLCGRAHLDSLRAGLTRIRARRPVEVARLLDLPQRLLDRQRAFRSTGGLHAAAYLADDQEIVVVREDVGRHNAVDKVVGALLEAGRVPVAGGVLWVSGRAGAEIVLKAARAGIPVLAAVGAPTSLAIDLADAAGLTLVGFLREGRMNVYAGAEGVLG